MTAKGSTGRAGVGLALSLLVIAAVSAQERRGEPAEVLCPSVLGVGVNSRTPFCDIPIHVEPHLGIQVVLPPHDGEATLSFNLHNRHTYSQEEEQAGRAYTQYLASIAVATMEGEVIGEGVVFSEFRTAADLVDRVTGGAGASGLKAIAPTGVERVYVTVPADVDRLAIVGESVQIVRLDGRDVFTVVGRPIAILSDATLDYRPR